MKMTFNDIFIDNTRKGRKILKENYHSRGKIPIIDQGKNQISGFSDEKVGIYKEIPVIIFGDHTRIIKYVDCPFLLGADGVKILSVKTNKFITKYLYYALLNYYIPDTGYNRHFKWLKNFTVNVNSINEQKRIVITLDKIITMIDKKKKQINLLEELVKSRFIEMFGDPIKNDKGWDKISIKEITSLVSRGRTPKYIEESKIGVINQACVYWEKIKFENIKYHEDKKDILILQNQDILINSTGTGTLGRVNVFIKNNGNGIIYTIDTHVTLLRLKEGKSNSIYLKNYFRIPIIQNYLINKCVNGSTNQIELSKEKFNNFKVLLPPLSLQNEFSQFVEKTDKLKFEAEKSLKEMENLYESLMQKFFKQN